jgi:hypothetical protein
MYTNMVFSTSKYTGTAPEVAVPSGWTVAAGTANSPSLTGWSSTWDAAGGVSWNVSYSTAAEFPNSPSGFSINYNGTPWDNGNRNAAFDNGSAGDLDGVANRMGTDARITVPAGTAPGTYTVMVLGVGHNEGDSKAHIEQAITVTVPDTAVPTVNTFTMPATATSLTVNVTAFTASDNIAVTGYKITESATVPLPGDAGWTSTAPTSFTFSGSGTKTAYAWAKDAAGNVSTSRSSTVTITFKLDQTITFNPLPVKTYGDADFAPGGSASSGLTVTYASSNPAVATIVGGQVHIVGAGITTLTATQAGNTNYNAAADVQQPLTVNAKALTITAEAKSKTYGATDPTLTYTATGLVGGDTISGSLTRVSGESVGDYAINQGTLSAGSNYSIAYTGANLSVTPRAVTVTADAKSKTFGNADPALTYQITSGSLAFSDAFSGSLTRDAGESVGTYAITQGSLVLNGNYDLTYVGASLTITEIVKLDQTITFGTLPTKTYGDADFSPGASASSGLTVSYASSDPAVATIIGGQIHIVGAGTATITASQAGDATYNPAPDVIQSLTVNKAAQVISFSPSSLAKTYGNADFSSVATTSSPLAVTYDSSNSAVATVSATTGLVHIVGAGSATITANLAGDANHDPASAQLSLTVDTATLTVSAANASRSYGDANPTFTPVYSGFVLGETAAVLTGIPELTTTADSNSPVGSYPITAGIGTMAAANYTFSFGTGTLAVDLASQTITFNPLNNKTYGDTTFVLTATGGASGNPVSYTSSNEAVATVSGDSVTIVGAGTTTIIASQAGNSNYASATAQQNLVVDKASLTVSARNVSRPYNTDNPTFTPVYNGFVNGETAAVLAGAPDLTTTATKTSPVGSYPITANAGTLAAANYTFAFAAGTLGIDIASQSITFDPLAAKTYGDTTFDLAATGGESGNPVTFTSSNEAVATVSGATVTIVGAGTTTITASQAGNGNYASATAQQSLAVNKAPLIVTAQPASRDYGTANPTLVPAYSGFVFSENAAVLQGAPELATSAVIDSPVGSYPITATAGNLFSNNYAFTFVAGALTVNQASQAITITQPAPATAVYTTQFIVAAIAPGGAVTYSSGSPVVCTNVGSVFTMIAASGTCVVQYDQAGDSNYLPASQATNSVTADKANQTIGAIGFTPATLTVSGTTTVGATATSGLSVSFSSSTPAVCTVSGATVSGVSAGTCTIIASQAGDASYNAALDVTQSLTVTSNDATLTVGTSGAGNGTVNSSPAGISCPGDCTETVTSGTPVSLFATPDWKSDFAGWSGACSGTGACNLTMDTSKGVTAIFNVKPLVKMPGPTYYATIQDAYNAAAEGTVIELRDQTFTEDLVLARSIGVTLNGGMDDTFANPTGYTFVNGSLSIVDGSVSVGNLVIQ